MMRRAVSRTAMPVRESSFMAIANVKPPVPTSGAPTSSYKAALAVVTTLFFMWGFVTVLNDILVPHLKSIFDLNYTRVMLIQFAFFSAYFVYFAVRGRYNPDSAS